MRPVINLILISIVSYYALYELSWWIIAPIAALSSLLLRAGVWHAFISGFLAIGLLWFWLSWKISLGDSSLFLDDIAQLLGLKNSLQLAIASGLLGGSVAGCAAMCGGLLREVFRRDKKSYSPYV